ncbi:MAG: hypothetical protein JWM50_1759 [Microbacteriaceae bacterium]|jgi:hypothetical protein|nr:hypothetical protein [Microbacteriaceae bacterium]
MEIKTKIVGGTVAIAALALAAGLSLTGGAFATPATPASTHSTVSDGDGETADDVNGVEVEDGTNDGETADDATESGVEDPSDDVNGVEVEDGTAD